MARSKFYNHKTVVDGITFDSKAESIRYGYLKSQVAAGSITDLRMQVKFDLVPAAKRADGTTERAASYIADFVYTDATGAVVVEDVKSKATAKEAVYILKRKLMLATHGITIHEIL